MPRLTPEQMPKVYDALDSFKDPRDRVRLVKALEAKGKDSGEKAHNRFMAERALRLWRQVNLVYGYRDFENSDSTAKIVQAIANRERTPKDLPNRPSLIAERRFFPVAKPAFDDKVEFAGGKVGKAAGLLATGVSDVVQAIPLVERLIPDTFAEKLSKAAPAAQNDLGMAGSVVRTVGQAIPVVLTAGLASEGLAAAGASDLAAAIGSGAITGALTTPGGVKDRAVGAGIGALTFAAAHGLQRGTAGLVRRVELAAIGNGVAPSVARRVAARTVKLAVPYLRDTAAFTTIALGEQAFRPGPQPDLLTTFLSNAAVVGVAMSAGGFSESRRPGARFAKGRQAVGMRRVFAAEPGVIGKSLAREAIHESAAGDALQVELAYRAALKGMQLTVPEAEALIKGGPDALRAIMAPERAADVFAPDVAVDLAARKAAIPPDPTPLEQKTARIERLGTKIETKASSAETTFETRTKSATDLRAKAEEIRAEATERIPKKITEKEAIADRLEARAEKALAKGEEAPRGRKTVSKDIAKARARALRTHAKGLRKEAARLRAKRIDIAERRAKAIEKRADDLTLRAEGTRDLRIDRIKKLRILRDKLIEDLPEMDAVARVLPEDSVGSRVLEDGGVEAQNAVMDKLAAAKAVPRPDAALEPIDAATAEGVKTLKANLAKVSEMNPSKPRTMLYRDPSEPPPLGIRPSRLGDKLLGIWSTFPRIFGPELSKKMEAMFTKAIWKEGRVSDLMRRSIMDDFHAYHKWLLTLPDAKANAALDRFFALKEGGARVGESPAETALLNKMHQVFGRYARMLRARGILHEKPLKSVQDALEAGYFPHIFETVRIFGEGAAQKYAAEIVRSGRGTGAASRFMRERTSSRSDYVKDIAFVLDAYINSVTRAIYWSPVSDFVNRELPKILEDRVAANIAGREVPTRELARIRRTVQSAQDFAKTHVDVALGAHNSEVTDFMDSILKRIGKAVPGLGFLNRAHAPARELLKGYVYAQYIGGLGLNIGSAIRNITQQVNSVAEIGPLALLRGYRQIFIIENGRLRLNPILRHSGLMSGRRVSDIRQLTGGARSAVGRGVTRLGDGALAFFGGAEWLNRASIYMGSFDKALRRGLDADAAKGFARRVVARTQFDYGRGIGGTAYTGPFAHAIFQFTRFPIYQGDYLANVIRRAVTGDTSGMLPGDLAIAPLARWAAGSYALAGALAGLSVVFDDGLTFGGVPDPIKLAATKGIEFAAGRMEKAKTGAEEIGREKGRRFARSLNLEPFSRSWSEAFLSSFGPAVRQADVLMDSWFGTRAEQIRANRNLARSFVTVIPGLAFHRLLRYFEEKRDQAVRSSTTGEVMFPLDPNERVFGFIPPAEARLLGMNSKDVVNKYEQVRDVKQRDEAYSAMNSELLKEIRRKYQSMLRAKDPDAAPKAARDYLDGLRALYLKFGVAPGLTADEIRNRFVQNVIIPVKEGENLSAVDRLLKKHKLLRRIEGGGK